MKLSAKGVLVVEAVRGVAGAAAMVLLVGVGLGLGGCDRKDAALDALNQTSIKLRTSGGAGEASRKVYAEVAANLSELSKNGQRSGATASLLISVAQLGLADGEFTKYLSTEAESLSLCDQIRSGLSQYLSMHEAAKGADSFSVAGEMGRINGERAKYQEQLTAARSERASVEQQITTLRTDSRARLDATNAKLDEASKMTEGMARLSSADGAAAIERAYAIKVRAESDRRAGLELEAKAAMQQPVFDEWNLRITQYENQLRNLAESEKSLHEQERLAKQSAADARSDAGKAQERVASLAQQLQALRMGPVDVAASKALSTLKKALDATREGSKPTGNPGQAALVVGMVQQSIGETQWSRAAGHGAYAASLTKLAESQPPLPAIADYASKAEAATKAQGEASDAAKAAFADAQRAFERASSGNAGPGAAAAKEQLKALAARYGKMSGKASDSSADATAAAPAEPAASTTSAAATGAYDPELKATLERFLAANKAQDFDALLAMRYVANDQTREMVRVAGGMLKSLVRFDTAMKAKFGQGLKEASGGAPGMDQLTGGLEKATQEMNKYSALSVDSFGVSVINDQATAAASGLLSPLSLKKVDGKWMIVDIEMEANMANPQVAQQMGMMKGLYGPLGKAANDIAAEVEQGKHASAQAAFQAFGMRLMPLMQQMMQGGGGGG